MKLFRGLLDCSSVVLIAVLASTIFLASGVVAQAGTLIGVGNVDPPLPMNFIGTDMIMVGSPDTPPIEVIPSPNGPPWMKIFTINRDGRGWPGPPPAGQPPSPDSMVGVMEFITFAPATYPGTTIPIQPVDWHEDIDPNFEDGKDFKWAGGSIVIPGAAPIPGTVGPDGKSIWFNFPPVPPGTPIKINKQLMWNGGGVTGTDPNNTYIVKINERPSVPEPGTIALIGLAATGVTMFTRRRIARPAH